MIAVIQLVILLGAVMFAILGLFQTVFITQDSRLGKLKAGHRNAWIALSIFFCLAWLMLVFSPVTTEHLSEDIWRVIRGAVWIAAGSWALALLAALRAKIA